MRDIFSLLSLSCDLNTWWGGEQNIVLAGGGCYCLGTYLTSLEPVKNGWTGWSPCPCPTLNELLLYLQETQALLDSKFPDGPLIHMHESGIVNEMV